MGKVLEFPENYFARKNHFNEERKIPVTLSEYVHVRLKCCDD